MPAIRLPYHEAQERIFWGPQVNRYNVVPKGRRFGGTQGAAHACIEWALAGDAVLWGDTISANVDRYVDRYFMPPLREFGLTRTGIWDSRRKLLRLGAGHIDFRSADRPENWEGFGYRRIILNEAGIILRDEYLYRHAVLPMMADYEDAQLWAIGTPKGAHGVFFEMWQDWTRGRDGYWGERFSSYQNPYVDHAALRQLEAELGHDVAQQEIYAQFVSATSNSLFTYDELASSMDREQPWEGPLQLGVDVAWTGEDSSTIYARRGYSMRRLEKLRQVSPVELAARTRDHAARLAQPGEEPTVNVDAVGLGAGVYDLLAREPGLRAVAVSAGSRAQNEARYANVRAEMHFGLRDWVREGGALPQLRELRRDLAGVEFELDAATRYKLPTKDKLKKRLGHSPDDGDAAALCVYHLPPPRLSFL